MKLWPVHIYQHQRQCLSVKVNFGITATSIPLSNTHAGRYPRRNFVGVHLECRLGRRPPRRRLCVVFFSPYRAIRPWPLRSTGCPTCYSLSTCYFVLYSVFWNPDSATEGTIHSSTINCSNFGDVRCKVMYNTPTEVPPEVIWKMQASRERPILSPKFNKYDVNSPLSSDKGLFCMSPNPHSKSPNS
jgi:hypothetical protein